jgi:DHA1 family multidrug resistance protein-like MFS transporter
LLAITVFIDLVGFGIIIPNMPRYVTYASGATTQQAGFIGGLLAASYSFTQFLFAPLWGALSDRVGRRPIILLSQIGYALSFLLFGFAGHHLYLLFAGRLLAGLLSSASIGVAFAYIADVTTPERRAAGIGILGACLGLGFMVGPAIGGWLGYHSLALPAFVAAGVSFLNFLATMRRLPESLSAEARAEAKQTSLRFRPAAAFAVLRTPVWSLYALTFLVTFAFTALEQNFSYYLLGQPAFHISPKAQPAYSGTILGIAGLVGIIVQGGLIGRLVKRFGEGALVRFGILFMAAGFAIFAIPQTIVGLIVGPMLLLSLGRSLTAPALSALVSRKATAGQGLTLSTSQAFDSLARTVGPITAGTLFNYFGIASPYHVSALVMIGAFVLAAAMRSQMILTPTEAATKTGGSGVEVDAEQLAENVGGV